MSITIAAINTKIETLSSNETAVKVLVSELFNDTLQYWVETKDIQAINRFVAVLSPANHTNVISLMKTLVPHSLEQLKDGDKVVKGRFTFGKAKKDKDGAIALDCEIKRDQFANDFGSDFWAYYNAEKANKQATAPAFNQASFLKQLGLLLAEKGNDFATALQSMTDEVVKRTKLIDIMAQLNKTKNPTFSDADCKSAAESTVKKIPADKLDETIQAQSLLLA